MKYYEITKHYRNAADKYYILLTDDEPVTEDMLQSIGEHTKGGECYGYRMESKEIESLPIGEKLLSRERKINIY